MKERKKKRNRRKQRKGDTESKGREGKGKKRQGTDWEKGSEGKVRNTVEQIEVRLKGYGEVGIKVYRTAKKMERQTRKRK